MERNEQKKVAITPLQNLLSQKAYQDYQAGRLGVVAICKNQSSEKIISAIETGYRHLGENTLPGLLRTAAVSASVNEKTFLHFVGRLQSNKIKKICAAHTAMIHSIAHVSHLEHFKQLMSPTTTLPQLLLQINVAHNPNQDGLSPDVESLSQILSQFTTLPIVGLMAIGPNPERFNQTQDWQHATRESFQKLASLREDLIQRGFKKLVHLSMGMSSDYSLALEAGATLIRLGTCVFGTRTR